MVSTLFPTRNGRQDRRDDTLLRPGKHPQLSMKVSDSTVRHPTLIKDSVLIAFPPVTMGDSEDTEGAGVDLDGIRSLFVCSIRERLAVSLAQGNAMVIRVWRAAAACSA